jgi:lipopolysaccharide transport system ATP-binding protein
LEVGTGFHPELTGRENVFMNGTILGMTKKEIENKFDEIVEFSGVEQYIDTPVKFYSSGMKVRLAFSVAAHLEPDILIIDEVLAVGDVEFQKKCLGKMDTVAHQGKTVLFVSHDMGAIQTLCSRAVLLKNGRVALQASTGEVVQAYLAAAQSNEASTVSGHEHDGKIKIKSFEIRSGDRRFVTDLDSGGRFSFLIEYESEFANRLPSFTYFHIFFKSSTGQSLFVLSSKFTQSSLEGMPPSGSVECEVEHWPLVPGAYTIDLVCKISEDTQHFIPNAMKILVVSGVYPSFSRLPSATAGPFLVENNWSILKPQTVRSFE